MKKIFLDTETTGFGQCRMVEIAIREEGKKTFVLRVKPPIPIEEGAFKTHGISNEEVANLKPFQETKEYPKLKKLIEENLVLAHNARFDIGVLEREGIAVPNFICTQRVAQKVYPHAPNHKLQGLRQYLQIDVEGEAHSAGGDVAVLAVLFDQMWATIEMNGTAPDRILEQMAVASLH